MKYIKTFEQFINESKSNLLIDESVSIDMSYAIKSIKKYNSMKKPPSSIDAEVLNDLAEEIIKHLGSKPDKKNIEKVSDHLSASMDSKGSIPYDKDIIREIYPLIESVVTEANKNNRYTVVNGFTFETVDGKKFTLPRKAVIETINDNGKRGPRGLQSLSFRIVKGKLDGHEPDKKAMYEVDIYEFDDFVKDKDIELNESIVTNEEREYIDFINEYGEDNIREDIEKFINAAREKGLSEGSIENAREVYGK